MLVLLVVALGLRIYHIDRLPLWVDEAESCINALTILEHGYPGNVYLGLPIYENTLTMPWPENPEYEFKDSSYGRHGLALYHGWLPLYSIAAFFRIFGVAPDEPGAVSPRYSASERQHRTVIARLTGVLFGVLSILGLYLAASRLYSRQAGLVAAFIGTFLSVHVNFSQQARYYGPTLAAVAFCAWSIACMLQRGRRRDFVTGGILFALLFHTHIVSFFIAAIVLALGVAYRRRSSFSNLAIFSAIVAAACVPWIIVTGLPWQMSGIPPAWRLMSFPRDLIITRVVKSEFGATVLLGSVLLTIGLTLRRRHVAARVARAFTSHIKAYALLYTWMLTGYFAFMFLTPAASFWITRLALTLLIPMILLISMLLCACGRLIDRKRPHFPALAGALAFVGLSNSLHHPQPTDRQATQSFRDLDAIVEYLRVAHLRPGTLLFATPNDQLVLTFYTGLPVQSIAPVRKSFLDSYPGDLILFEREGMIPTDAIEPEALRIAAGPATLLTDEGARAMSCEIASYTYRHELAAQVAGVFPPLAPIPPFAIEAEAAHLRELRQRGKNLDRIIHDSTPIFRNAKIETGFDWWNRFFYAFVDPERRMEHPNYSDRFRNASANVLACTDSVALYSRGRSTQ